VNLGDYIVTRGYLPENLPDNLRSLFVNAAKNWVDLCRKNISGDIAEVTASADKIKIVKASSVYAEDFVLNSLTPIQYISCFVESCKNKKVPNATRTECVVDEVKDFASLCTAQQGASVLYGTNGKCSFGSGKTQEEVTSKCNAITSGGVKTYVKQIGVDFVCVTNQEAVWDGENFKQNMNACKCDDKSGGLYCDLDDATRTRCVIRTCKDSNKIPDVKGLKCVDKTDANIVTKQSDGNVVVADVDVVAAEGQNCRSDVYVADNVISAKYVKNQKGGLTCQLTCSGNMIGKLDYDLEKYKCVVDTNADQVNLTGKSFKQKCDILTGIVDGVEYTGGYFTEKGIEYCTPYNWNNEQLVQDLCNKLGAHKCKVKEGQDYWTCNTGNNCNMFNLVYPNVPSDEFLFTFNLPLPDCSKQQLDELSALDGVYENGSCRVLECKNGMPVNDDGTCRIANMVKHAVGGDPVVVNTCKSAGGNWNIDDDRCECPNGFVWNEDEEAGRKIGCFKETVVEHNVGGDPAIVAICSAAKGQWNTNDDRCQCPDGFEWNENDDNGMAIGCYRTSPIAEANAYMKPQNPSVDSQHLSGDKQEMDICLKYRGATWDDVAKTCECPYGRSWRKDEEMGTGIDCVVDDIWSKKA